MLFGYKREAAALTMSSNPKATTSAPGKPIWRQPLVHFLLVACAVFLFDALRGGEAPRKGEVIVISPAQIERLRANWAQSWDRPPDDLELEKLIDDHVAEEIYNREARALQLDQDDAVIRRYLRQKMELLTTGSLIVPEPSESEILAYFADNIDKYAGAPQLDFQQVYLGQDASAKVETVLAALRSGYMPEGLPEQHGLPSEMTSANQVRISRVFGVTFYDALAGLEPGSWQGPVRSALGVHLVKITLQEPGAKPAFSEVKDRVAADWQLSKRGELEAAAFERLKAKYDVRVEFPKK